MTQNFWIIASAILGLVVGSFLNVVISRLRTGESFLGGRSHCPKCGKKLENRDLIPVISFFFLRGKCRACKERISWQYPAVELITALVFGLAASRFSLDSGFHVAAFVLALVLCGAYIVIGVYDVKYFLILDKVIFPGLVIAAIYAAVQGKFVSGLIGAACVSGFFLVQYLLSRGKWIGFGDVKFGLLLGMSVGFPAALVLLFLAYMMGAFVGLSLIAWGKKQMGSILPFGVFLAASAVVSLFYGQQIVHWYTHLIGLRGY